MSETFGSLISRIADKLIVDDMDSQIGTAINLAINYYQDEALWFTQAVTSITLNANDPVVPSIPSDVLYERQGDGLVLDYAQTRYPLVKVDNQTYDMMNVQAVGMPSWYTYRDGEYQVYFYPDQTYTMLFRYQKFYPDLVQTSDSNDWLVNAARLIEAKTLCDFYLDYRHEPEMSLIYGNKATAELIKVRDQSSNLTATGMLITENIINKGIYDYDPIT